MLEYESVRKPKTVNSISHRLHRFTQIFLDEHEFHEYHEYLISHG